VSGRSDDVLIIVGLASVWAIGAPWRRRPLGLSADKLFGSSFEKSLSLIAWCANCSGFELIAATLNDLVRDLVDHLLDEQAQVTSATEI
jgi:hypothetical protein